MEKLYINIHPNFLFFYLGNVNKATHFLNMQQFGLVLKSGPFADQIVFMSNSPIEIYNREALFSYSRLDFVLVK